jgi:hypothetical protein
MSSPDSFFQDLSAADIEEIKSRAVRQTFSKGQLVFAEGDQVDWFYIIEQGRFGIFIDKQGKQEHISELGPGDYFGEMAIFNRARRLASVVALQDAELLAIDQEVFLQLLNSHRAIADKINVMLSRRNEELVLRENLIDTTGLRGNNLHISIKGDPSIRESAFSRGRYQSVVDGILPELVCSLEELLLYRCVYKVFIAFNSGEVRLNSVFDPFYEETHTADKLVDRSYIERHFPCLSYRQKTELITGLYTFVMDDDTYASLPQHWKNVYRRSHENWQPIEPLEIAGVLQKLVELRNIQNFYLRNFSLSMVHNAIRLQFNCDGTHIVSTEDYQRFVEENLQPG